MGDGNAQTTKRVYGRRSSGEIAKFFVTDRPHLELYARVFSADIFTL